jgi:hypothetical protein
VIVADAGNKEIQDSVDAFLNIMREKYPEVEIQHKIIIHNPNNKNKAVQLNLAIREETSEEDEFLLLTDKDEVFRPSHVSDTLRYFPTPDISFCQTSHTYNPSVDTKSVFSEHLGIGVDIHWDRYHHYRNKYGFVMLLGHSPLYRRSFWGAMSWDAVDEKGRRTQGQGWPEIVSEDLAFSLFARWRRDVTFNYPDGAKFSIPHSILGMADESFPDSITGDRSVLSMAALAEGLDTPRAAVLNVKRQKEKMDKDETLTMNFQHMNADVTLDAADLRKLEKEGKIVVTALKYKRNMDFKAKKDKNGKITNLKELNIPTGEEIPVTIFNVDTIKVIHKMPLGSKTCRGARRVCQTCQSHGRFPRNLYGVFCPAWKMEWWNSRVFEEFLLYG